MATIYKEVEAVLVGERNHNGLRIFKVRSEFDWGQQPAEIFKDGDRWLCTDGEELCDNHTFVKPITTLLNKERIELLGIRSET